MDGYYHRNQHISNSWDQRYSSPAYDYSFPHGVYLNRRGSLPSGKYHGFMSSSGSTGGFYGSGGNMADCGLMDMGMQGSGGSETARTNLIVNYLPQSMNEKELYLLFVGFGAIESCRIMKDFKTGYSYGFGFVNFMREEDASAAIAQLNGFTVQNKRLKVSYARPSGDDIKETNLYVTGLPRDITDAQLEIIFCKYGRIVQKHILRDKLSGMTRGVAFVRYDKREEAQEAISALNNVIPDGGSKPLVVRIAEEHGKKKAAYYAGWMAGLQNRGDVPWGFDEGMDMYPQQPVRNNMPPAFAKMHYDYYNFRNDVFGQKNTGFPKIMGRGMNKVSPRRAQRGGRGGRGVPWISGDDRQKGPAGRNRNTNPNNFW